MKRFLTTSCCVALLIGMALAQGKRATLSLSRATSSEAPQTFTLPLSEISPFLAWSAVWRGEPSALQVRFSSDGRRWEAPWMPVQPDAHAATDPDERKVSNLSFEPAQMRYFQVRAQAEARDVVFHFFSPGASVAISPTEETDLQACPCPKPPYLKRQDWCPAGNCLPHPNPAYTTVTHLIVHHSATANTANDWAAVVRAIWDFHVNTNGWADIGYNWLIDPNGTLYEGRGDNVIGAHFCGANSATMGVCMLGDYTNHPPSTTATKRLRDLLAWKLCAIGAGPLDSALHLPSGRVLPRISGHRDGCSTACPGNVFYPTLPNVRSAVANYIAQVCNSARDHELPADASLLIYPNPARQILFVECTEPLGAWLRLFYPDGRPALALQWLPTEGRYEIALEHLPAGVYTVHLLSPTGQARGAALVKW